MGLAKLLYNSKVNFTDCIIASDGTTDIEWKFDISPQEFISFAKRDIGASDKRGVINAVTNAKRAIDCQIDTIFKAFGYEFDDFPDYLRAFCRHFCDSICPGDASLKLKIINAFDMAPAGLVSEVRILRNKLEHYYNAPKSEDARKSIEIAELFVSAASRKLSVADIRLTDITNLERAGPHYLSGINISYNYNSHTFRVRDYSLHPKEVESAMITPENNSYAALIRMCINCSQEQEKELQKTLVHLLKINNHKIPSDKVHMCYKSI